MIWKNHRHLICLFAFVAVFFSICFSSSRVSALDWVINPTFDKVKLVRTASNTNYPIDHPNTSAIQYIENEGTGSIPWTLLGNNQNNPYIRWLWGFTIYRGLGSYNYNYQKYTSLTVDLTISATNSSDYRLGVSGSDYRTALSLIIYDTNSNSREVGCSVIEEAGTSASADYAQNGYVKYRCSANFQENAVPQGFHLKMYPVDNVQNYYPNYGTPNQTNSELRISYFGFQIKTDRDASDALLEENITISRGIKNELEDLNSSFNNYYNQDQSDRNAVQGASDNATSDGNQAGSQASNATSSLLGAITNIYGVLLHPTQTNCNIGPINLYNQMDLGTLDMCTFNTPQPIMAIGALLLIGLIILLAWSVLNATMSLYKDLFGGTK